MIYIKEEVDMNIDSAKKAALYLRIQLHTKHSHNGVWR